MSAELVNWILNRLKESWRESQKPRKRAPIIVHTPCDHCGNTTQTVNGRCCLCHEHKPASEALRESGVGGYTCSPALTDVSWRNDQVPEGGDCRKLVTLEEAGGMTWVGIRAWDGVRWLNNGNRELAKVLAWQELPPPSRRDGLMKPMSGPTLPEGPL